MSTQTWVDWYPLLLKDLLKINPQATKTDKKTFDAIIKGFKILKKHEFDYTYCSVISHIHKYGDSRRMMTLIQVLKDVLNSKVECPQSRGISICGGIYSHQFCDPKDSDTANLLNQLCRIASDITRADRKSLIFGIDRIIKQTKKKVNISDISKILFVLNPLVFIPITRQTRAYVNKEFDLKIGKIELSADDYFSFLDNLDMKNKKRETYVQIYSKARRNETTVSKPTWNSDFSSLKLVVNDYNKYMDQVEKRLGIVQLEPKDSESLEAIEYEEGGKKLQFHYAYERDPGIRKDFLEQINEDKRYSCAVCGFSFFNKYGDLALNENNEEFIEVHHKFPLFNGKRLYKPESITREFVCLCPNCHRMIHRYLNKLIRNGKITQKNYESQVEDLKKNLKK